MKSAELIAQLEQLQRSLFEQEHDSDWDSLMSKDTEATSVGLTPEARSQASSPIKKNQRGHRVSPPSLHRVRDPAAFRRLGDTIQKGTSNLENVLDCLEDMALQQSALIELCLAEVAESLAVCPAMNTYTVHVGGIYPNCRK